jgi:glycosyltransferase involved in cell wall biosynthesis
MPVIPPDYGGAVRVFNVAQTLSQNGVEVVLVSPRPEYAIEFDSKIEFNFFEPQNLNVLQKIPMIKKLKYFLHFFCFRKQFNLLKAIIQSNRDRNISLILQSEYIYSIAPLYLLKKSFHLPLVITEHNVESKLSLEISHNRIYYHILKAIECFYLHRCDYVVCVSNTDKMVLNSDYAIPSEKLLVVPNATNLPVYAEPDPMSLEKLKSKYGISADKHIILFMGTMEYTPNLNAMNTIESVICPYVCSHVSNAIFLIVGKGVQPKTTKSIIFTGRVDDVAPYLRVADLAIAPLTEGSGTRLKILEYMAYGKPVVSTSKGAEGLDVIDNKNIIIADDWVLFSEAIVALISDKNKRDEIGRNARLLVEEKYTWEKCCETYIRLYQKLLSDPVTN